MNPYVMTLTFAPNTPQTQEVARCIVFVDDANFDSFVAILRSTMVAPGIGLHVDRLATTVEAPAPAANSTPDVLIQFDRTDSGAF